MRAKLLVVGGVILAGVAIAMLAQREHLGPRRCPEGLTPLGARCCGAGQTLEDGACRGRPTTCSSAQDVAEAGCVPRDERVRIAGGALLLGPSDWEAQGVVEPRRIEVATFDIDAFEVTEIRYGACLEARGCDAVTMTGEPGRPVQGLAFAEADRFCAWAGGRLPSSDELAFAAAGTAGRRYAWGNAGAVCRRAAFGLVLGPCGDGADGPETAGARPAGRTPEGVFDLAGNVAEWAVIARDGHDAEVRGGSFTDAAAASLRHWHAEVIPKTTRARHVGVRCVY